MKLYSLKGALWGTLMVGAVGTAMCAGMVGLPFFPVLSLALGLEVTALTFYGGKPSTKLLEQVEESKR